MVRTFDYEAEKDALREKQRAHLATIREAEEAEHDSLVRAYWDDRAAQDPEDPEVLRARADLIARDRGQTGDRGAAVAANPAQVAARGNR